MASLTIKIDERRVNKLFGRLLDKTDNLQPAMKSIGEIVYNGVMDNFRDEKSSDGTPWRRLLKKTIQARLIKHPGSPIHILHETGNLERSLNVKATNEWVTVGTNVIYAGVQQFGYPPKNIPARPYLGVKDDAWEEIRDTIKDYIMRATK